MAAFIALAAAAFYNPELLIKSKKSGNWSLQQTLEEAPW